MAPTFELIKKSFADYLSKPYWNWSWYCTATFDPKKAPQYPRLAEHSWRFFMSAVGQTSPMSYGFAFAESHKSGAMHWHALVHVAENLLRQPRRKDIWERMFAKYGYCQLLPYIGGPVALEVDSVSTGVARYLTKYLVKEATQDQAWWDFRGNMSGHEADAADIMSAIGAPRRARYAPFGGKHGDS